MAARQVAGVRMGLLWWRIKFGVGKDVPLDGGCNANVSSPDDVHWMADHAFFGKGGALDGGLPGIIYM